MFKKWISKLAQYYLPPPPVVVQRKSPILFDTHDHYGDLLAKTQERLDKVFENAVHPTIALDSKQKPTFAMDNQLPVKQAFVNDAIPIPQLFWYASQTFIGYQACAILAQQWLVSKACLMPAKDATRNGYEMTVNSGEDDIDPEILDYIRKADMSYSLNKNLIQFIQMGRIFGIRIAMFIVTSNDPDYYLKPFNPDGVLPGTYKGISQIDPYWITPQMDADAAGNPAAIDFYEPTWWVINGKPVHRTHLVIYRTEEVADILKPTYIFGGIPIPQKIAQRVYAAELTANEAPMLSASKRTDVMKVDLTAVAANPSGVVGRMNEYVNNRNNYGVKMIGLDDEYEQFDISLNDLDAVIMTQYQIVAAAANVPATKLLGTQPKGFNSSGEYEESTYHEELESIQRHDLTPLIERHHMLLIRSEVCPKFKMEPFHTTVTWNPLDAMTAKELSELNRFKAETGNILMNTGAIDGLDERERIAGDPDSGYNGLVADEAVITQGEAAQSDPNGSEFD